jgi:hypothetical protein
MNELELDAARSGVFKTTHAVWTIALATMRCNDGCAPRGASEDWPEIAHALALSADAVADAIGLLLQSMSGTPQDSAGELLNAECARAALELTSVLTRIMGEALEIYSLATEALADRVAFGYGAISTPSASAARPSCASPVAASRCTSSMANAPEAMSRLSSRPRR